MRLLGLDFEATGLDPRQARMIEMGAVLWDTDRGAPLLTTSSYVSHSEPLSEEVLRVTGITDGDLKEFGKAPGDVLRILSDLTRHFGVDYLVAHNAEGYDRPLLVSEMERAELVPNHLLTLPWIDTLHDVPYPEYVPSKALWALASWHGIPVDPRTLHRALDDTSVMMKVLAEYKIDEVLAYKQIPWIFVRALVSYEDRGLASKAGYGWEKARGFDAQTFPKMWVKRIKATQLEDERKRCPFKVGTL